MSAQHTPGPWIAERDYGSSHFSEVWSKHTSNSVAKIVEKRNGTVHVSYGEVWNSALTAETDANARLIAAAPELLQELRDVLDWALVEMAPLRAQEIESIRAVIAKATGSAA